MMIGIGDTTFTAGTGVDPISPGAIALWGGASGAPSVDPAVSPTPGGGQTLSYCSPCHYTGCDTATEGNAAFMMYGDPISCPTGSQPQIKPNATPGICDGSQWTCYTPPPCSALTEYLTDPCMSKLTPAQLTQFCGNLVNAWAAGNTQSKSTPLGQKCQAMASGGSTAPPAGSGSNSGSTSTSTTSTSGSTIIPGVPDMYLYIGGGALLLLLVMKK